MKFRTAISLSKSPHEISLETPLLSIGSCFSNCIGSKLAANKFNVLSNPFGTIFNPLSIFKILDYVVSETIPPDFTYVQHDGIWKNLDFHSSFSDPDKSRLEEKIRESLTLVRTQLPGLSFLLITPGTAWVYETAKENYLVSNCHKLPPENFNKKRLLSPEEISLKFEKIHQKISTINPSLRYIFTVSPVRHIKDTLELNSWSKAILLMAVKNLTYNHKDREYFPSYEIMMDDLRDYRFYGSDMIHPNDVAENYIWDEFANRYFRNNTLDFLGKWSKIKEAIAHKPFHAASPSYKAFIHKTISKLHALKEFTDVSDEIKILKERIDEY